MESVVLVVPADTNVSEASILDTWYLLRTLLFFRNEADEMFASLPNSISKALVIKLLIFWTKGSWHREKLQRFQDNFNEKREDYKEITYRIWSKGQINF